MDSLILTYVTLVLSAVMFARMFTYRRGSSQFRRDVSIMAALIMVLLLAVLTASLMRCGGNLSKVLRHPYGWDGRERRRG